MQNSKSFSSDYQPEKNGRPKGSKNKTPKEWLLLQELMLTKYFESGVDGMLSTFDRHMRDMPEKDAANLMMRLFMNRLGKRVEHSLSEETGAGWVINVITKDGVKALEDAQKEADAEMDAEIEAEENEQTNQIGQPRNHIGFVQRHDEEFADFEDGFNKDESEDED